MGCNRQCFYIYNNANFIYIRYGNDTCYGTNETFGYFADTCMDGFNVHSNFFNFNFSRYFRGFRRTNVSNFGFRADGEDFVFVDDEDVFFVDFDDEAEEFDVLSHQDGYGLCCISITHRRGRQ